VDSLQVRSILSASRHHQVGLINLIIVVIMTRKALKSFTFSDGTHIPVGTTVVVASTSMHHDEDIYTNAEAFNAFRFSDMLKEDGKSVRHPMDSTGSNYVPFGHGRHAW